MILDLIRTFTVMALVAVAPGWFWARCLCGRAERAELLIYSTALSMALVSAVALALARILGGVTLPIAIISPLVVLGTGFAAHSRFRISKKSTSKTLAVPPPTADAFTLMMVALAFALVLASDFEDMSLFWLAGSCQGWAGGVCTLSGYAQRFMLPIVILLLGAGAVHGLTSRREPLSEIEEPEPFGEERRPLSDLARRFALPAILLLVLARGYLGPVLHDWPYIRGLDHYSHAVMANLMMSDGKIQPYLVYPPGFHTLIAVISRLSGLDPLRIFSVLGPALLLLPALSCYALARRLWGWEYGLAAAFFAGAIMGGSYYYFNDAMYPNLVAAQFLLVLTVAALIEVCRSPSARTGILLALLGSSVVLYHQVSSLYLALILAPVTVFLLPYMLLRRRKAGLTLLLSLTLLASLSLLYALSTYDILHMVTTLTGGSRGGETTTAVNMALGTQGPYSLSSLIVAIVSQPVAWLGLLGAIFLVAEPKGWINTGEVPARAILLLWALVVFVGSRTSYSGFPQRFGRDLGIPLSLLAALAFVVILKSLLEHRKPLAIFAASLTVLLLGSLLGLRATQSFAQAAAPSPHLTITPGIAAAGGWLKEHNDGGNIMVSPQGNQVPSRMMLAMGHYSALQSFTAGQIAYPRDLPPTGPGPLRDVLWVMTHPDGELTRQLLEKYDVRYIVLYKSMPDRTTIGYWRLFAEQPDLYKKTFENDEVLIVARR